MKHSLKTKILIYVPSVFIAVMLTVAAVILIIHKKESRKEAEYVLNNSFEILRYNIRENKKNLIENFQQSAKLNDLGGILKYIDENKSFFKYGILRPAYLKMTDIVQSINAVTGVNQTYIYNMNGELMVFSVMDDHFGTLGFMHNRDIIESITLKPDSELSSEVWQQRQTLPAGLILRPELSVTDREFTKYIIKDSAFAIEAYIPITAKDYNTNTEKMESVQVGLAIIIQKLDDTFIHKMSQITGTDITVHVSDAMMSDEMKNYYKSLNPVPAEDTGSGSGTEKLPLIFGETEKNKQGYYSASLPIYSNSQCIAVIEIVCPKQRFQSYTAAKIKLLSFVYVAAIMLIVPATMILVIHNIINPINRTAAMMRRVAQSKDFTQMLDIDRQDEIGELAESFNEMTANLQKTTTSIDNLHREIEQRRYAEEMMKRLNSRLEDANNELKNFAYIASHDLREPLRTITAFGQLLDKSLADKIEPDDAENLHFMLNGAKRMSRMIDGLLNYSRINTQGQEFEDVEIAKVLDEILQFDIGALVQETHTKINVPRVLPAVYADPLQIRQLIQNLITNAIKYRKKDTAAEITITGRPAANGMVRLEIADNGIGIPPEYHNTIFGMFKRLPNVKDYEGTGIGLAVCKKIVQRHNGQIGVESQPDKGSTFWFTVPAAKTQAVQSANTVCAS
jgi:signal transduction histidine kinase